MTDEQRDTLDEFREAVNMAPKELEDWLETDESKSVGQDSGDGESKGHKSGKRIVKLLHTKQDGYSDDDFEHMQKVVGYVHRHSAQKPDGDVKNSDWRYSLMNWGHDPSK